MRLWIKVVRLFQTIDFEQVDEFDQFKNINNKEVAGFASMYLLRCEVESKSDDEIDIRVYTKLVELDSRLGTTAAEQLFKCLEHTRWDLIKVIVEIIVVI